MYLKYLDAVGFKSFAERTRLEFEPGVTVIVGPNGCGKSNVVDAIRWCLGEMSAKSLRSSVLMDVIFNGTESRTAQNMAEVSLTFDNSSHLLPIDYSEVTVSRRLYRSGESEYFINKTQCRLRDIRELFLDTGMGEDGYSVMEQGRVEYILQAKPEERRELFEEAAGVSKYKARRDEAQRKLEKVEVDLSRLADVINLTKEQMDKLEASVKKAQQYQKLEQDLKIMELEDLLFQTQTLKETIAASEGQLQNAQEKVESLTTQTHGLEAHLQELRLSLMQKQEEFAQAGARKSTLEGDVKLCEERLRNSIQRHEDLENRRVLLEKETASNTSKLIELRQERESLLLTKSGEESSRGSFKSVVDEMEKAHQELHTQLTSKQEELTRLNDEIFDCGQAKTRLTQTLHQLRNQATRTEYELQSLYKDRTKSQLKNEELKNQSRLDRLEDIQRELGELRTEQTRIGARLNSLRIDEKNAQEERQRSFERTMEIKGRLNALEELGRQDPYASGIQALMAQNLPGIHGPLGRFLESPAANRDIVRTALGERTNYLVAETQGHAENAIRFLLEQRKGRARFIVLDHLPTEIASPPLGSLRGERALLELVRYDPFIEKAVRFLLSGLWVSGSTVYGQGIISGGVDPAHWQAFDSVNWDDLQASLAHEEGCMAKVEERSRETQGLIDTASQEKNLIFEKINEVEVSLRLAKKLQDDNNESLRLIEKELEVIQEQISRAQSSLREWEEGMNGHETQLKERESQEAELRSRHDLLQRELNSFEATYHESASALATRQGELKAREDVLQMAERNWLKNQSQIADLESSLSSYQKELEMSSAQLRECLALQNEMKKKIGELAVAVAGHEEEVRRVQEERDHVQETLNREEKKLESLRGELAQAQEALGNEKIHQSHEQARFESALRKIEEAHNLTWDTALQSHTPKAGNPETMERLRRRLGSIGPVNLAAPEEHAQLQTRYDFLFTQQQDLLKAKDDLHQVIVKINATTRESFRETFGKVRESFKTIYGQLFSGGEADLRLTSEEDLLNAGVEIYAQPPGKKLQHISLLSGGEKALTANALLFAFFETRPAPVAFLDEVDAPLDEANVVRFTSLLKSYAEKTQFVIISHNKRTMEIANNLYGVTMEEQGVSKILSAKLTNKRTPEKETAEETVAVS